MSNKINSYFQPAAGYAVRARSLAARAEALAAEFDALNRQMKAAGDEEDELVRRAGFRCNAASGSVRTAAGELQALPLGAVASESVADPILGPGWTARAGRPDVRHAYPSSDREAIAWSVVNGGGNIGEDSEEDT